MNVSLNNISNYFLRYFHSKCETLLEGLVDLEYKIDMWYMGFNRDNEL